MTQEAAAQGLVFDDGRPASVSGWRSAWRGFRRFIAKKRLGAFGLFIVVVFILMAVLASVIGRYDPDRVFQEANPTFKENPTLAEIAKDPNIGSPFVVDQESAPSAEHWFGTDGVGRDIYARVIHGAGLSLTVGFGASFIAVGAGLLLGVTSGYYRGWFDLILQRFVDALQAFPALVLLLLIVQIAEPSVRNTVIALGIVGVPITTRLVRSTVLSVSSTDYVAAARAVGATDVRIMLRHVVPNISAIVLIAFSIGIGAYILFEATISFLGVGPNNVVSWGKMVQEGRGVIQLHPWLSVFAGGAIALLVVGFNFLGDALRDVLDPRLGRG